MNALRPSSTLALALLIWVAIAAPGTEDRRRSATRLRALVGAKAPEQRAATLDNPAYRVAAGIRPYVPAEACVGVLAYAGPAAIDYYRARLAYLLYPRRVRVAADSAARFEDCAYLALFRDTEANLAAAPFAGAWDRAELERRLRSLETIFSGSRVSLYRLRPSDRPE